MQVQFVKLTMASKIARNKGDAKGKSKASSSSNVLENEFSLVDVDILKEFEEKCQHRLVLKRHVYNPTIVETLHILDIVSRIEHKGINYFLQLSQDYNEELIECSIPDCTSIEGLNLNSE